MLSKTLAGCLLGLTAAAVTVITAQASVRDTAEVYFPFAVELHGKMIPAGKYWVHDVNTGGFDTERLDISDQGGRHFVASVQADPVFRVKATDTNEVEINTMPDGTHYLQKIWVANSEWGYGIPKAAATK